MGIYLRTFGKTFLKGFIWTLICCIPTAWFIVCIRLIDLPGFWAFEFNPLYLSIINYRFITKKNAFFIWLFLVALQTPWYFPYIFRETDEWLAIPILISYIGNYQIIGITICFAVACLIKYIIFLIKKKKASVEVQSKDIKENS